MWIYNFWNNRKFLESCGTITLPQPLDRQHLCNHSVVLSMGTVFISTFCVEALQVLCPSVSTAVFL